MNAPGATCFHCGQPADAQSSWRIALDGASHPACCAGCEAVAQTIIDSGLADYYRHRTSFPDKADTVAALPPQLALLDRQSTTTGDGGQGLQEATFAIEGIRCAACSWLIERRIAQLGGVADAAMNAATEKLRVRWDESACRASDIVAAVHEIGYRAYPYDAARHDGQMRRAGKVLFRQMFIAGLSMMQVMMYAAPGYIASDGTLDADSAALMRWASLLLTLPAVCYSALPFFRGAWSNLKQGMLGMDVPVTIGIVAAFTASLVATLRGAGEVYFDSVTMFVFLLLCSRYLEHLARQKAASAMQSLQHALPASAWRVTAYPADRQAELVAAGALAAGDVIQIRPGDAIAADAEVIEGATEIDASLLTGESLPQRCQIGDRLPGGAVNVAQPVLVRVIKPAGDSTLSALARLAESAGYGKPALALWADRVAAWFVAGLLLFAMLVFMVWQWIDPSRAWPVAIAVMVVSCPCALSLAMPTALSAATADLLRRQVLVVRPHVLETLHRATHIVFDKTGTLTRGRAVLRNVSMFQSMPQPAALNVAAALASGSNHPLSQAIAAAGDAGAGAVEVRYTPGQGLEGAVGGTHYRLGNAEFVAQIAGQFSDADAPTDATAVYLGMPGAWLARFDLADSLREDAVEVVRRLQAMGKTVLLLSGDRQVVADRIGAALGIDGIRGDCTPQDKLDHVRHLQEGGAVVAMVGDGINDAAVLSAADVSFAMGSGAEMAQVHADAVLYGSRLTPLADAADTAAKTMRIVRQNLGWAMLYNVIAIPAAALGWITPWMSAIGMSASSAIVVVNALRLHRARRDARQREASARPVLPMRQTG
jgi:Cu2+-exporting ATPase